MLHLSRDRARRRTATAVAAALLLIPALAACGGEAKTGLGGDTAQGFDAVSISGKVGQAPKVKWKAEMTLGKGDEQTKTLEPGKGAAVKDGDKAKAHLWIGNGTTQRQVFQDYVGEDKKPAQPTSYTASKQSLGKGLVELLVGAKPGSRTAGVMKATDVFGAQGNTSLGVAPTDALLVIADVVEAAAPPKAQDVPAAQQPKVVEKGGKVTGLDFTGLAKPSADGKLLRTVLKKGDGEALTTSSTVKARYLGQVYGGKKPFDENFSGKDPAEFSLQQVVEGWTYGLEGVKVGSRVLLTIPSRYGYGEQAQPNIPANSTLYFVIDVVSAS